MLTEMKFVSVTTEKAQYLDHERTAVAVMTVD